MDSVAPGLTILAVLIPALQSNWSATVWIALTVASLCGWVLIVADIRRFRYAQRHHASVRGCGPDAARQARRTLVSSEIGSNGNGSEAGGSARA
jgi:ABC-type microcin C transport system permease subunit YejE